MPRSSAAAKTNGLKADPGWRRLRLARLKADCAIVAAADQRQHVAGVRVDARPAPPAARRAQPAEPARHGAPRRRPGAPRRRWCRRASRADGRRRTRRGSAAGDRPWRNRAWRALSLRYGRTRIGARRAVALVGGVDESGLAHPGEDDVAAGDRAVEVRPRRQRRRRPGQPGDQRALGHREVLGGLAEHPLRHRLHAVDAGAEVDAVEVQLEDLLLGELRFDQHRQHGLAALAQVAPPVRQEERARQLLGDRAAALDRARRARIADDRARHRNRVDARMAEEAMVLDGDERVLEVRRDGGDRHVVPLLVEPEPAPAVGGVEPGVADPAGQRGGRHSSAWPATRWPRPATAITA